MKRRSVTNHAPKCVQRETNAISTRYHFIIGKTTNNVSQLRIVVMFWHISVTNEFEPEASDSAIKELQWRRSSSSSIAMNPLLLLLLVASAVSKPPFGDNNVLPDDVLVQEDEAPVYDQASALNLGLTFSFI